jgi:hypothetical protein
MSVAEEYNDWRNSMKKVNEILYWNEMTSIHIRRDIQKKYSFEIMVTKTMTSDEGYCR